MWYGKLVVIGFAVANLDAMVGMKDRTMAVKFWKIGASIIAAGALGWLLA